MVLSRSGFGFLGNILPAGHQRVVAGIGWFAVNSVSGALALHALFSGLPKGLCLLSSSWSRRCCSRSSGTTSCRPSSGSRSRCWRSSSSSARSSCSQQGAPGRGRHELASRGGFLIMVGAAFGYAAGWNPYASDYTRYLPPDVDPGTPSGSAPGSASSCSCVAARDRRRRDGRHRRAASRRSTRVVHQPAADLARQADAARDLLGAIAANALNMYSGVDVVHGARHPAADARGAAVVALVLRGDRTDRGVLRPRTTGAEVRGLPADHRLLDRARGSASCSSTGSCAAAPTSRRLARRPRYRNWAGPIAMFVGWRSRSGCSPTRPKYIGPCRSATRSFGDLTFEVGFVIAAVLYSCCSAARAARRRRRWPTTDATAAAN